MSVDKPGNELEVDEVDAEAAEEAAEAARRRRRGGLRVPSDAVPRPTRTAPTPAPPADDEPDVDVDLSFGDGVSASADAVPHPVGTNGSGPRARSEAELEAEELADDDLLEDDRLPTPVPVTPVASQPHAVPVQPVVSPLPFAAQPPPLAAQPTAPPPAVLPSVAPEPVAAALEPAEELESSELEEDAAPAEAPPPPPAAIKSPPPAPPPVIAKPPAPPKPAAAAALASVAEPKPKRRKARAWFEEIFDDDYLRTLPFLTPQATQREAAFLIEGLGTRPGQQVLDVGCGYGRHAMELAARGLHVVALDLSLPLLLRGADEAQRRGLTINFVHGDMRELSFDAQFDGAYCVFSSFGFFDDEMNKRVLHNIARALKPGARFVLDVLNRDYIIGDLPTRVWWEGDACVVLEEVEFNYFTSRLVSNRSVVFEDGRQLEQEISVRAYSLHELGKLLHQAGFRVIEVSGGLAARGRFFGNVSRNLIVVAERKPDAGKDSKDSKDVEESVPERRNSVVDDGAVALGNVIAPTVP